MPNSRLQLLSPNVTYLFAICFAKLSILFLYRRLFPVHREKIFIWIGIIMNIVLSTTFMALSIANLIECIKFTSGVTPFCRFVHEEMVLWVTASNVFTDFYIAILPIPRVLNLQTSNRRKFGLCLTFASGLWLVHGFQLDSMCVGFD
jgi:sterol-4alpha-carboxylate 3-dehydrogenase (decarboxylating)